MCALIRDSPPISDNREQIVRFVVSSASQSEQFLLRAAVQIQRVHIHLQWGTAIGAFFYRRNIPSLWWRVSACRECSCLDGHSSNRSLWWAILCLPNSGLRAAREDTGSWILQWQRCNFDRKKGILLMARQCFSMAAGVRCRKLGILTSSRFPWIQTRIYYAEGWVFLLTYFLKGARLSGFFR